MTENKRGISRNNLDDEIVNILWKHRIVRYSDIKKMLNISDPTLWKHLLKLQNDNIVEFTKKGKEKQYRLARENTNELAWQFRIATLSYLDGLDSEIYETDYDDFGEYMEDIGKKITPYLFFMILKSFENGKNTLQSFDSIEMFDFIISHMEKFIFGFDMNVDDREDLNIPVLPADEEGYFKEFNKLIDKKKKYKQNLKKLQKMLEQKFPNEISKLENPTRIRSTEKLKK